MTGEVATILFGVISAVTWGGGDFCGGLATRRSALVFVMLTAQITGLIFLTSLALLFGEPFPGTTTILWAAAGGIAGMVGIAALYGGLARGQAALIAPVSAAVAAALPAIVGSVLEGAPGPLRLFGFGLALVGIWLITGSSGNRRDGLIPGLIAGLGFGAHFVFMDQAAGESTYWATSIARITSFGLTLPGLLIWPVRDQINRQGLIFAMAAGLLDSCGNALYALAASYGRLDIAAVLASLYPASTVTLARIVLHEHISPTQTIGLVAAFSAIVCIAL